MRVSSPSSGLFCLSIILRLTVVLIDRNYFFLAGGVHTLRFVKGIENSFKN